jgi:TRAP-type C4-dicarboxylate transport system substrate-binding protein
MKRNNAPAVVAVPLSLALLLGACGTDGAVEAEAGEGDCDKATAKLAHKYPTTHFFHEVASGLKEEVSEGTDGRITIEIYPAEQLLPEAEEVASTASGAVQITMPSTSEFHDYNIPAEITSLPFAVNGFEETRKLRGSKFEELYGKMIEEVEAVTVHGFVEGAGVNIIATTKGPLKTPADFKGLKLRANNASVGALFQAYGAPALTQPVSDVYTSLERGTIDGAVSIPTSLVAAKWYEAAPHITLTPGDLGYAFYPIISNKAWFEGLCQEDQKAFTAAVDGAVESGQDLAETAYADSVSFLEKQDKVTVHRVPDEERPGQRTARGVPSSR